MSGEKELFNGLGDRLKGGLPWLYTRMSLGYACRRLVLDLKRKKEIDRRDLFLDVGCITPDLVIELAGQLVPEHPLRGVAFEEETLKVVRRKVDQRHLGEEILLDLAPAGEWPHEREILDHALVVGLVKYLGNTGVMQVLEETKRVLKPGGKLFLLDFCSYPEGREHKTRKVEEALGGALLRSREELLALVQRSGFEGPTEVPYGTKWWPPVPKVCLKAVKD